MTGALIGYARCSTDKPDLEAYRQIPPDLGVLAGQSCLDRAYSGTDRDRPGLDQALAAVRTGDTLVVPKPDRLTPSVPDAPDRRLPSRPQHPAATRRDELRPDGSDGQDVAGLAA